MTPLCEVELFGYHCCCSMESLHDVGPVTYLVITLVVIDWIDDQIKFLQKLKPQSAIKGNELPLEESFPAYLEYYS